MFFHTQYIHLFRPFLKYTPPGSPLPSHVSPRRICTANAGAISKLMRLYKKTWNLRQIPNIAIYMLHGACVIHILNLPEKTAKRDIIHGVKHLEEIAEDWIGARRTLGIISVLARKWNVELPEEASLVLQRTDEKWGTFSTSDVPSPPKTGTTLSSSPEYWPSSPGATTSPQTKQESPQGHFSQPQLGQDLSRSASDLLMTNSSLAAMNDMRMQNPPMPQPRAQPQPQMQLANPPTVSLTSESLRGSGNTWGQPAVTQPLPSYGTQFRVPQGSMGSSPATSQSTRQVSPSSIFAEASIDGQDWFLNDGVRWHQNFGHWGLSNSGPVGGGGSGVPGAPGAATTSPAGSSASAGLAADPVFMFRGTDDGFAGFDTLNASLNGGGWLTGLD